MKFFEQIHFDTKPVVLAAWPGMGNVGLITVDYLRSNLNPVKFAELDMSPYFIPDSIIVKDGIAQLPKIPTSIFYYCKNPDLIIFESSAQIAGKEGILIIKAILDMFLQFPVERIFTFAAFAYPMSHTEKTQVMVSCNSNSLLEKVKEFGVVPMPDGYIAGLNGLLLGVAASRQIDAACLLGTIPSYATSLSYPKASLELIKSISEILGIETNVAEISEDVEEMDQQYEMIEERIKEFMPSVNRDDDSEISELEDEKVPHYIMEKIEDLFIQASKDRSKATELKKELDRWKLFELYENRFLDLFEKE